jgi:hypothetical protein
MPSLFPIVIAVNRKSVMAVTAERAVPGHSHPHLLKRKWSCVMFTTNNSDREHNNRELTEAELEAVSGGAVAEYALPLSLILLPPPPVKKA